MPATLRIVNPRSGKAPITVPELLDRLSSREFDKQEAKVRSMREAFHAPQVVVDHQEYHRELLRFYAHYHNAFWGGNIQPSQIGPIAWDHLRRLHKDLSGAERDAILNRSGGFIAIIDQITEAINKQVLESYIDLVFFDFIPRDQQTRLDLATELLNNYISVLFPNEPHLKFPFLFAGNIEEVLKEFALRLHDMGRSWRW